MRDIIKNTIIRPGLERIGSVLSAVLVGWGISQPVSVQIAVGITAALGVAIDLAIIHFAKWRDSVGRPK